MDKYISCDNNKLAPIFAKLKHIVTKRLVGRKIKPFVNLIFHGLLWKKKNFEPFPMEFLTPSKMVHLGEINKRIFEELNKIDLQTSMSFRAILNFFYINKETYINALHIKLKRPTIFLQRLCKNIRTNPFGIHVGNIW